MRLHDGELEAASAEPGEVVLLENVRFLKGEKKDDPALAARMAALCDVFVMDAFGTAHRAEASTHGVALAAPVACAGPLLAAELDALERALDKPKRPLVAVVGGSKVSTKLEVLESLIAKVDQLVVGGGIANTFLAATGVAVGKSLHEPDMLDVAKRLLAQAKARGVGIPIPSDVVVAREFAATARAETKPAAAVGADEMILDIGPASARAVADIVATGRHRHLERAARRVRVRRLRRRHEGAGRGDREEPGVLDRGRGRHARRDREVRHRATTSPTFRPAAGRSSSSSRARRCRRSPRSNGARQGAEMARRTKIVATLGPATDPAAAMADLIAAGVDLVRVNFSHGSFDEHARRIEHARAAAAKAGRVVGILGDLRGPKVRIERFADRQRDAGRGRALHARPGARPDGRHATASSASPTSRCRATCARATRCC